jgi:hypothetical protein
MKYNHPGVPDYPQQCIVLGTLGLRLIYIV